MPGVSAALVVVNISPTDSELMGVVEKEVNNIKGLTGEEAKKRKEALLQEKKNGRWFLYQCETIILLTAYLMWYSAVEDDDETKKASAVVLGVVGTAQICFQLHTMK